MVKKNKRIVDDQKEDIRGTHIIESQPSIGTDNHFVIDMDCLASVDKGILLQLIHIMIGMLNHISMKSSPITTLIHMISIPILHYTNTLLLTHSTMAQFINHAILSMVVIVKLNVDTQLGILVLVDMVAGIHVTMSLVLVSIVMQMNSIIGLSIAPSSLKRLELVVKSLFPCGEETDKRSDAATVRNVRANGSQFAHQALLSLTVISVPLYAQMEQSIIVEFASNLVWMLSKSATQMRSSLTANVIGSVQDRHQNMKYCASAFVQWT